MAARVEPLAEQNRPQIQELDKLIFGAEAWSALTWQSEFASKATFATLLFPAAEQPGTIAGFTACAVAGDDLEIRKIGILPGFRNSGLGMLLLKQSIAQALSKFKAHRILVDVAQPNGAARKLYQNAGFREIARRKAYYADGNDALVLELIAAR